jgi:hypothetical protein
MNVERQTHLRPDGAKWTEYLLPSRGVVVLTSSGRELLHDHPHLWKEVRNYRKAVTGRKMGELGVREHLASGGNSDVYFLGSGKPQIAVKEAQNTQSAYSALLRMDTIQGVVEKELPRWFNLPPHYGLLDAASLDRQYLFMEAVDAGITLEDIQQAQPGSPRLERVRQSMGKLTDNEKMEIRGRFDYAHEMLLDALWANDLDPEAYLTDWHEGNVLVERLATPIAESHFLLSLIDQ